MSLWWDARQDTSLPPRSDYLHQARSLCAFPSTFPNIYNSLMITPFWESKQERIFWRTIRAYFLSKSGPLNNVPERNNHATVPKTVCSPILKFFSRDSVTAPFDGVCTIRVSASTHKFAAFFCVFCRIAVPARIFFGFSATLVLPAGHGSRQSAATRRVS